MDLLWFDWDGREPLYDQAGTYALVKSLDTCLGMLIRCAGGDGNVLLNVGPKPTGEIAAEQANLLRNMGGWPSHRWQP